LKLFHVVGRLLVLDCADVKQLCATNKASTT